MPRKPDYEPTPEEIRKVTAEIRRGWSGTKRAFRNQLPKEPKKTPYETPVYSVTMVRDFLDDTPVFTRIN